MVKARADGSYMGIGEGRKRVWRNKLVSFFQRLELNTKEEGDRATLRSDKVWASGPTGLPSAPYTISPVIPLREKTNLLQYT